MPQPNYPPGLMGNAAPPRSRMGGVIRRVKDAATPRPLPPPAATSNPNTGIVPPHMQRPRAAAAPAQPAMQAGAVPMTTPAAPTSAAPSMQAAPRRPPGAPAAPSGINPGVPGITMRDVAQAPDPIHKTRGGLMGMPALS